MGGCDVSPSGPRSGHHVQAGLCAVSARTIPARWRAVPPLIRRSKWGRRSQGPEQGDEDGQADGHVGWSRNGALAGLESGRGFVLMRRFAVRGHRHLMGLGGRVADRGYRGGVMALAGNEVMHADQTQDEDR